MANSLVTLSDFKSWAGVTVATYDTAYQMLLDECADAVIYYLKNGTIIASSYTVIFDAPPRPRLYLPHFPVLISSLAIYVNEQANGVSANFTADDLLVNGTDYVVQSGPDNATYSYSGLVTSLDGIFGLSLVSPFGSLSTRIEPSRGAIKATYTAGWATVPPSLQAAIYLMTQRLFIMRKLGFVGTSNSWNGESVSLQTPQSLLWGDPTIRAMLKPFGRGIAIGGYTGAG